MSAVEEIIIVGEGDGKGGAHLVPVEGDPAVDSDAGRARELVIEPVFGDVDPGDPLETSDGVVTEQRATVAAEVNGIRPEMLEQLYIEPRGYRGKSPAMERCLGLAAMYARLPAPILIYGETGTGKRDLVKAIHQASGRSGPLITVDCSQVPNGLLASTLFGHNRGSFTGAVKDQVGLIEQADGGTLCLDEVENLPPDVQQMLLLPLDSKNGNMRVRRLGNGKPHDFSIRLICAANTALEPLVQRGELRRDLFQRISTLRLQVPALRQRGKSYMHGLIKYLVKEIAQENLGGFLQSDAQISISPEVMEILASHQWQGNVRELNSVLYCAMINAVYIRRDLTLSGDDFVRLLTGDPVENGIDETADAIAGALPSLCVMRIRAEVAYLRQLLTVTEGNVKAAAEIAGTNDRNLYRRLKKFGLDPERFRRNGRTPENF